MNPYTYKIQNFSLELSYFKNRRITMIFNDYENLIIHFIPIFLKIVLMHHGALQKKCRSQVKMIHNPLKRDFLKKVYSIREKVYQKINTS